MQNEWKPIKGYEGLYEISRLGEIKSIERDYRYPKTVVKVKETTLKQRIDRGGYYTVVLHRGGRSSTKYIHRLVAIAFIANEENNPIINHKNGNKLDNTISNLEWVTSSQNMKHAFALGLTKVPPARKKRVVDPCQKKEYASIKEASEELGIGYKGLLKMLSGERKNKTCLQLAA